MEKNKIIMVSTPSSRRNLYYDFFRKHFPQIEIVDKKIEEKINGNKISFIAYDEIECLNNKNINIIEIDSIVCNDKVKPLDYYKVCRDCKNFGELYLGKLSYEQMYKLKGKRFGCIISSIEAKHVNKNTPACLEFKKREDDATLKIAGTN